MNKNLLMLVCCLLYVAQLFGQADCGFDELMRRRRANPEQAQRLDHLEEAITARLRAKVKTLARINSNISIPIVFHVIYNSPEQNISDAKILEQLAILNRDLNLENTDTNLIAAPFKDLKATTGIKFCLATRDTLGNPTTGILRYSNSTTLPFNYENAGQFVTPWDCRKYLNIFIGDLDGNENGYSSFPGLEGNAAIYKDYIVIDYAATGLNPNHPQGRKYGRTLTHEVGHFFGLRHIFGDGSCEDFVEDTPPVGGKNLGVPSYPHISTCAAGSGISNAPNGDLFYNYMDYTDDTLRVMFTEGQRKRMLAMLYQYRSEMINAAGCNGNYNRDVSLCKIEGPLFNTCGTQVAPTVKVMNTGSTTVTAIKLLYGANGFGNSFTWTGSLNSGQSASINLPAATFPAGRNDLSVAIATVNNIADENQDNDTLFAAVHTSHANFPFLDDAESTNAYLQNYREQLPTSAYEASRTIGRFYQRKLNQDQNTAYTAAMGAPFVGSGEGSFDMTLKEMDLSSLQTPYLYFDIGARLNAQATQQLPDSFFIEISTDCGQTYTKLFRQSSYNLGSTYCPMTDLNTPLRKDSVSLLPFNASTKAWIRFRVEIGSNVFLQGERDLYLDNIAIRNSEEVTAIPETGQDHSLAIFPNPADQTLYLHFNKLKPGDQTIVQLLDNTGRVLYHIPAKPIMTISTSALASGIYYLRYGTFSKKILVQHH